MKASYTITSIILICITIMFAPIAAGTEMTTSAAEGAKLAPAELPLILKTKVPIIFIGEIRDIVSNYEDRPPGRDRLPRNSDVLVSVRVLKTLKSPDGNSLPGHVYLRFGGIFKSPRGLETTWEEMTSTFAGRRLIFFGYSIRQVGAGSFLVHSGGPIKPEAAEKEQEVRGFLDSKN